MNHTTTRIALGLLLAVLVSWGLQAALSRAAAAPTPVRHFVEPEWIGPLPAAVPQGRARRILLVGRRRAGASEPSPEQAPVVRMLAGGALQVLRGAPPPTGPGTTADGWRTAVVELPGTDPADLGAEERARLLELLRAWGAGSRPVVEVSPPTDRLLRWLR